MTDHESWSLFCSMLVFLMFLGLLMIEAGCVRSKNAASVFLRGLASLTISLVTSWICGFMFAHSSGHYLIGFDSNYSTLHRVPEVTILITYSISSQLFSNTGLVVTVGDVHLGLGPGPHHSVELHVGEDSPHRSPHHLVPLLPHHLPSLRPLDLASRGLAGSERMHRSRSAITQFFIR